MDQLVHYVIPSDAEKRLPKIKNLEEYRQAGTVEDVNRSSRLIGWKLKSNVPIRYSSVMHFNYEDKHVNILDTGHEDFSEDTYRTLIQDSDYGMWIRPMGLSTNKKSCLSLCMREFNLTFMNKLDRDGREPVLVEELEKFLIDAYPMNWPLERAEV